MAFSKACNGDSARRTEMETLKERSFTVEVDKDIKAIDIVAGSQNNLGHPQIDTPQETGLPGKWLIIAKTREDVTKLVQQEHITCKGNKHVLTPKIRRATPSTIPYTDPDITNKDIKGYFSLHGNLRGVAYEYYKESGCENIKTGRRLVFIEL